MASIYVGTYAKYNSGSISGKWIDPEDFVDKEDFLSACAELHSDESDPELMFQDWEGIPDGMIGESHVSDQLWDWLELSESDRELLAAYREACGSDDATVRDAQDNYIGRGDSEADIAQEFAEECEDIPEKWAFYIDWEKYARDIRYSGDWSFIRKDGEVWAFWNH